MTNAKTEKPQIKSGGDQMRSATKTTIIMLLICMLGLLLLTACDDSDDEEKTPTPTATSTENGGKVEKVKITIGNHTDKTGAASQAMQVVDAGLADVIKHYNDNNLIPGVEVDLVEYDGMLDPGRDIPGWLWLQERGADLIMGWLPALGLTLGPLADEEQFPFFTTTVDGELIDPPGYVLAGSPLIEDAAWTLIDWVMQNDWDWQTKGPAKVGGGIDEAGNPEIIFSVFKKYAEMYPERMEWIGGYTVPVGTYTWASEVESLKDADYIYLPNIFPFFLKDYVQAGYDKAKFLTTDNHTSFLVLMNDMGLWPEFDGTLNLTQSEWWTEDAEYSNFARELASTYRSSEYDKIAQSPKGYNSFANGIHALETIKLAAETVGPENIDSQALYEAAQKLLIEFDGVQRFSYTETKRTSPDRLAMYVANAETKGFDPISEWFSVQSPPE